MNNWFRKVLKAHLFLLVGVIIGYGVVTYFYMSSKPGVVVPYTYIRVVDEFDVLWEKVGYITAHPRREKGVLFVDVYQWRDPLKHNGKVFVATLLFNEYANLFIDVVPLGFVPEERSAVYEKQRND